LAERFDPARFAWSYAAAEARRVVESLQRGRADWGGRALGGLSAAERALDEVAGEAEAARPVPRSARVGGWLASLLDPSLRLGVPGVDARVSRVGAVWPDGDEGAIVRLERSDAPGPAARWLKLDDAVCAFDFPSDPGLPALAGLLTGGSFAAAGHRLGKRAALRELHGDRFLFLRAPRAARKAFERVRESHRRLEAVGVAASRPLEFVESLSGWWAEGIPGRALEPAREEPGVWAALGELLSRAHAAHGGDLPTTDGRAASLDAARKQVSLVRLADPAFADELDRDLSELPVDGTTGRPAWPHGDLHPLQILVGPRLVVLDWERARVGEAEEDLGNLLAHLAWAAEDAAAEAWRAFLAGYARAGGEWDSRLLLWNARVSMVRVRAVHGWRDGSQARARDAARWRPRGAAVHAWQLRLAGARLHGPPQPNDVHARGPVDAQAEQVPDRSGRGRRVPRGVPHRGPAPGSRRAGALARGVDARPRAVRAAGRVPGSRRAGALRPGRVLAGQGPRPPRRGVGVARPDGLAQVHEKHPLAGRRGRV